MKNWKKQHLIRELGISWNMHIPATESLSIQNSSYKQTISSFCLVWTLLECFQFPENIKITFREDGLNQVQVILLFCFTSFKKMKSDIWKLMHAMKWNPFSFYLDVLSDKISLQRVKCWRTSSISLTVCPPINVLHHKGFIMLKQLKIANRQSSLNVQKQLPGAAIYFKIQKIKTLGLLSSNQFNNYCFRRIIVSPYYPFERLWPPRTTYPAALSYPAGSFSSRCKSLSA